MANARTGVALRCVMMVALLAVPEIGCSSDGNDENASPPELSPDAKATPGEEYLLRVGTHCGVERLGLSVNGISWITDEAGATDTDWMPEEWEDSIEDGLMPLTIVLSADHMELTAAASGHAVSYRPIANTDPEKFCE